MIKIVVMMMMMMIIIIIIISITIKMKNENKTKPFIFSQFLVTSQNALCYLVWRPLITADTVDNNR